MEKQEPNKRLKDTAPRLAVSETNNETLKNQTGQGAAFFNLGTGNP